MKRKHIIIVGVILGVVALVSVVALASGGGVAAAQGTVSATPLPPVSSGSDVIVDGKAVPVKRAELTFPTGGIVSEAAVQEGELVTQGQVLVSLVGREQAEAEVAAAEMEQLSARQALADLKNNASVLTAQAAFDEATSRKNAEDAGEKAWDPGTTWERQQLKDAQEWLDTASARYAYLQSHDNGGSASRINIDIAYQEYIRAMQNFQKAQADYDAALLSGGTGGDSTDADISRARADLAQAQWQATKTAQESYAGGLPEDKLALAEARVVNAEKRLAAAKAELGKMELRAPFAGTVVSLDVRPGEFIAPGAVAVALADLSSWQVETLDLNETDVVRVQKGDAATVTFDALPGLELPGKVVSVGAYGKNHLGEITYTVVIQLDKADAKLRWNMTAMVKIQ